MYSTDRRQPLDFTVSCLEDMPLYESCQKTLVVDGRTDYRPSGFGVIEVPRVEGRFCWANMWAAGVCSARFRNVVYLDGDRLLPKPFLQMAARIEDGQFMFTSHHFHLLEDFPLESCKKLLAENEEGGLLMTDEFLGKLKFEPRFKEPLHGPGKNVMSGSVVFTKKTFLRLGGVDPWYCGHGAYADTDFHMQAAKAGCRFIDLGLPELHCHHKKLNEEGAANKQHELEVMGLDNFVYYVWKWKLSPIFAESLAERLGLPRGCVVDKLRAIQKSGEGWSIARNRCFSLRRSISGKSF